ncbi:putative serine protease K12H4.7 [Daldinia childiae]|uniref:putative serine protease K12H4.7 n=1 Tax=Daldinia childiae TaxID=326645 RepID=UPI001446BBAB|nr:putative serine protease K12H4.7 [Daldinia childiae]KAF3058586.1 putative serine protease K12H4.7 [Daldinia childiae]
MRCFIIQYFFSVICLPVVFGLTPPIPYPPSEDVSEDILAALADPGQSATGITYFEQYIDHNNPDFGVFNQTYWYNATFWKGPGSPVILFTPGEVAATGYVSYMTDQALTGLIAKEVGGAVILVEHRYWGNSTPYEIQTTKNLQFLNLDQSVADFVNFAQTVKLPFDADGTSNASNAPWIWSGGSYSGALGAWIESLAPGTFWATHSSSGPVEAIFDYWQYFYPIQQGMPKNCSEDYAAIIDHVDKIFTNGSQEDTASLKQLFELQDIVHLDDVAAAISSPIWAWQSIQFTSGYSQFYQMCDAIEGFSPNSTIPLNSSSPRGVGLEIALPNFAEWFKAHYLPGYCASYGYDEWKHDYNTACFDTYNSSSPMFTDQTKANGFGRTWVWMTCNDPFFYYQTGAPVNRSTVFSRLANADYWQRQCGLFFPDEGEFTYGSALGKTASDINAHTKGWQLPEYLDAESRLLWVNGEFDPWRSASVASDFRPRGPLASTTNVPSILIPGSRHCNDLRVQNAVNPDIKKTQADVVSQIAKWTNDFYMTKREHTVTTS